MMLVKCRLCKKQLLVNFFFLKRNNYLSMVSDPVDCGEEETMDVTDILSN